MRRGGVRWIVGLGVGLVLASCQGSTQPASNISWDSARLEARGTADTGPTFSYFEYWPTAESGSKAHTNTRHWQSGVSGPFGEVVPDLKHLTEYSFRVCGQDEGKAAVCAQTLTFKTKDGDTFTGTWGLRRGFPGAAAARRIVPPVPPADYSGDFKSGPNGERPKGGWVESRSGGRADVTCMRIDRNRLGPRATIGTSDNNVWFFSDTYYGKSFTLANSQDCSQPFPSGLGFTNDGNFYVDFQIHDAP
jgi:hypothetical protein